jgi:hypothetical protein
MTQFDPAWMIDLIEKAEKTDAFLADNPKLVSFLLRSIPECTLLSTEIDPFDPSLITLNFVEKGSKDFKASASVQGEEADLSIDIMMDDSIGMIEVQFKIKPQLN